MDNRTEMVNILGSMWTVKFEPVSSSPRYEKCNGWCDNSVKECHIGIRPESDMQQMKMIDFYKSIARHEIIHAFLYESGIVTAASIRTNKWCKDEMMIDWMAAQMPKIYDVFEQLNIM